MRATLLILALGMAPTAPLAAKPPLTAPAPDGTLVDVEPGYGGVSKARTKDDKSPARIVCKENVDLGTRLPRGKVCTTRAQLAERRQMDREEIEGSQTKQTMVWSE